VQETMLSSELHDNHIQQIYNLEFPNNHNQIELELHKAAWESLRHQNNFIRGGMTKIMGGLGAGAMASLNIACRRWMAWAGGNVLMIKGTSVCCVGHQTYMLDPHDHIPNQGVVARSMIF